MSARKRYLITSALPYINGVKHLGNLVGSMLPADVYARYLRSRGHEVLYICATDEHGTPAELAALEAGLDVAEFCRRQHEVQEELGRRFELSYDWFGRSSSPQNREITQHIAAKLAENGFIEERVTRQVYSPADGRFLPDRYVTGTCPHCGYTAARGDQCESCTRVLDPTDLIAPRSTVSGSPDIQLRETRHLFLLQSKLAPEVRAWIETQTDWPLLTTSIARKWLDEGVEDRCITRDLKWGVPVNRPGFEDKVFYVWFDAPIEYIGATAEWADADPGRRNWRSWWYDAKDVWYVQFMAKDNLPFHTIVFPASLMGTREPWKLADFIKGFNWLNYYGGKFSTSQKRGVFMSDALDLLPADYWRWYLMANAPESDDSTFTWERFQTSVNADLVDNFGNFVNRIIKFSASRFGDRIPDGGDPGEAEQRLAADLQQGIRAYEQGVEALTFRKAVDELRRVWSLGNLYLTREAPWTAIKTDPTRAACVVRTAFNLARLYAVLSAPILPAASDQVLAAFGDFSGLRNWPGEDIEAELRRMPSGLPFRVPDLLFRKITDAEVKQWGEQFGGVDAEPGHAALHKGG